MFEDTITLEELTTLERRTKKMRSLGITALIVISIIDLAIGNSLVLEMNIWMLLAFLIATVLTTLISYIVLLQDIEYRRVQGFMRTYKLEV